MKIKDIYKDSSYLIQMKAPVLQIVMIIAFLSNVPILLDAIITMDIFTIILMLPLCSLLVVAFIIFRKGNYDKSSILFIYTFNFILISSTVVMVFSGIEGITSGAITGMLGVFIGLFFFEERKHQIILCIAVLLGYIFNTVYTILFDIVSFNSESMTQLVVVPTMPLVMLIVYSLFFHKIITKVMKYGEERLHDSEFQTMRMRKLADEASDNLKLAQSMEEGAIESASSLSQIEKNVQGISASIGSLTGQYSTSRQSLKTIADNMDVLSSVADDQSATIIETSSALEEMVAAIKNVTHVIESKMDSVRQLNRTADSGASVIQNTELSFKEVLQHVESVKQMVTLISGIASQTNLLAMNAAIEAAHAGEAGRGFAVVSDEVRKLAESSSKNAKSVSETLKQLVSAIEQMGHDVTNSGDSFTSISSEVSLVGSAMDEVQISITELAAGSDEILVATNSLNDLTIRVTDSVNNIKDSEKAASLNLDQLGEFVGNLGGSMGEILDGTSHISDATQELSGKCNSINRFVQEFSKKLEE